MRLITMLMIGGLLAASLATLPAQAAKPAAGPPRPPLPPQANSAKPLPVAKIQPLPRGVVKIHLDDLHCGSCAKRLARKLYSVPGVMRVRSSLKQDMVTVTVQPKKTVAPIKLWDAVIAAKLVPVEIRVTNQRLSKKHFPTAKTAVKPKPHANR